MFSPRLVAQAILAAVLLVPLAYAQWQERELIADIEREPPIAPQVVGHTYLPDGMDSSSSAPQNVAPMNSPTRAPEVIASSLQVPFTSQAPDADWSDFYQNTCEEASLYMVLQYLAGDRRETIPTDEADASLIGLVAAEDELGFTESITIQQLAALANSIDGVHATVRTDVSVASIEGAIANGHPVIVPTAGRMLQNPHFQGGGPWYHMLVITGFDEDDFITNDPGTAYGQDYRYPKHFLVNAIHDWSGIAEETHLNPKAMLILENK